MSDSELEEEKELIKRESAAYEAKVQRVVLREQRLSAKQDGYSFLKGRELSAAEMLVGYLFEILNPVTPAVWRAFVSAAAEERLQAVAERVFSICPTTEAELYNCFVSETPRI